MTLVRLIRWGLANSVLAGTALVCAGGFRQPGVRRYLLVYAVFDFAGTLVISPALASERSWPLADGIDPAVRPLASLLFITTVALGALDVGRIHLSFAFPERVQLAALAVFIAGRALQTWAMSVNAFFSTELRIQPEFGHRVIEHGPYHCIRHPGYFAMLLIVPSTAVALGSSLALLPAVMYAALILFRVRREDRYLVRSLPGYANYVGRARYRLIPGIW